MGPDEWSRWQAEDPDVAAAVDTVYAALHEATLDEPELDLDRVTLLGALQGIGGGPEQSGFRVGEPHSILAYGGFSNDPFALMSTHAYEPAQYCPTWTMKQWVIFDWANTHESRVTRHGTQYLVTDGTINAGRLIGFGGPQFFISDVHGSDYAKVYSYDNYGAARFEEIQQTLPTGDWNDNLVFQQNYWNGTCDNAAFIQVALE